jgi:hypothetical protein
MLSLNNTLGHGQTFHQSVLGNNPAITTADFIPDLAPGSALDIPQAVDVVGVANRELADDHAVVAIHPTAAGADQAGYTRCWREASASPSRQPWTTPRRHGDP